MRGGDGRPALSLYRENHLSIHVVCRVSNAQAGDRFPTKRARSIRLGVALARSYTSSERISVVAAGTGAPMLSKSSKQVAHCYRRAAECRELAERHEIEREFYLERERAWLTLARSFEFSERVGRAINDWQRQKPRNWPATQCISPAPKRPAPNCPACGVEMGLHVFLPMFVEAQKTYEDAFFVCPNCGHLRDYLAAL